MYKWSGTWRAKSNKLRKPLTARLRRSMFPNLTASIEQSTCPWRHRAPRESHIGPLGCLFIDAGAGGGHDPLRWGAPSQ